LRGIEALSCALWRRCLFCLVLWGAYSYPFACLLCQQPAQY